MRSGLVAVVFALGCGSGGPGSLSGKVRGQSLDVHEAVFLERNSAVLLAVADHENICGILWNAIQPPDSMVILESILIHYDGARAQPLVPGRYEQTTSIAPGTAGAYTSSILFFTQGCESRSALRPSSGSVDVSSYGGADAGTHLKVNVDLTFGNENLSGDIDAIFCPPVTPPDGKYVCTQ